MGALASHDDRPDAKPRAASRIRDVASELFYRQGIRAVGVDEIVRRAGVTKPSLYRGFGSKEDLAAVYLEDFAAIFWRRFDAAATEHPNDPHAQLRAFLTALAERASQEGYRGCALTNAALEYPAHDHPIHRIAETHKREVRGRLSDLAARLGARDPGMLADGLLLLIEGTFATAQVFGAEGPARALPAAAEALVQASRRA